MSDDREQLKLAAKAAGLNGEWTTTIGGWPALAVDGSILRLWQPMHDDGDAFRLAVKLGICIEFGECQDNAPVVYCGPSHERSDWPRYENFPDPYAATRRAIVRAAAAIGKAMP